MKKTTKIISVVVILLFILIILIVSFSPDENTTSANAKKQQQMLEKAEKLKKDSLELITYLNNNVDTSLIYHFEISQFSDESCRTRVYIPEKTAKIGADVVGKGFCVLMARFLTANGYTLGIGDGKLYVTSWVFSPYIGVTGKTGETCWGKARYDENDDTVIWTDKPL